MGVSPLYVFFKCLMVSHIVSENSGRVRGETLQLAFEHGTRVNDAFRAVVDGDRVDVSRRCKKSRWRS